MAPPIKLFCRDLRAGDVMLQFSQGNAPGKAIAFGQAMGVIPKSVFALDDAKVPPARLATCCEQSVAFEYVGYMLPNER